MQQRTKTSGSSLSPQWRLNHLLEAPHRLAFFLAVSVLLFASSWWLLVQASRLGWVASSLGYSLSPSLLHAALMTFGFMPLFFAGFLFTAGPKWLGVGPVAASTLLWPLLLQATGWVLWIVGGHLGLPLALAGWALALAGLAWVQWLYWQLLRSSVAAERLHASAIGVAGLLGVASLLGCGLGVLWGAHGLARVWVLTGLWGGVVATFAIVAHRMIPFFTASAVPMGRVWRPVWLMLMLLAAVGLEIALVWLEWLGWLDSPSGGSAAAGVHTAMLVRGLVELAFGTVLVGVSVVWGVVQSLKVRLLAMLHIGFVWLGLSFLLSGLSQVLGAGSGVPLWGLAALHALTMGFLGSVIVAMVTRVSSGHSGRPLVADNRIWAWFWLLQAAVLLRIGSTLPGAPVWLLAAAALAWTLALAGWGMRLLGWYGLLRMDGKPG